MKNQVQLTTHQLETWIAALSVFEPKVVNRAVLEIGLSVDPFPDLGKIVMRCQKIKNEDQYAPGRDSERLTPSVMRQVAKAMGLEV